MQKLFFPSSYCKELQIFLVLNRLQLKKMLGLSDLFHAYFPFTQGHTKIFQVYRLFGINELNEVTYPRFCRAAVAQQEWAVLSLHMSPSPKECCFLKNVVFLHSSLVTVLLSCILLLLVRALVLEEIMVLILFSNNLINLI